MRYDIRNRAWIICLLLAGVLSACGAERLSTGQVYGSWRIAEVLCAGCGGPVLALKGKVIEIGKQRASDPAGDNCSDAIDARFLRELDSRRALAGPGKTWPPAVRNAVAARPTVLYGFLTCGGINYMQILLTSPDSAYYFQEGAITLALTRLK